jgi:hypothetical protein
MGLGGQQLERLEPAFEHGQAVAARKLATRPYGSRRPS